MLPVTNVGDGQPAVGAVRAPDQRLGVEARGEAGHRAGRQGGAEVAADRGDVPDLEGPEEGRAAWRNTGAAAQASAYVRDRAAISTIGQVAARLRPARRRPSRDGQPSVVRSSSVVRWSCGSAKSTEPPARTATPGPRAARSARDRTGTTAPTVFWSTPPLKAERRFTQVKIAPAPSARCRVRPGTVGVPAAGGGPPVNVCAA